MTHNLVLNYDLMSSMEIFVRSGKAAMRLEANRDSVPSEQLPLS
jgi:hypothetical protein